MRPIPQEDRTNFLWWLGWILLAIGSLVASSLVWTWILTGLFPLRDDPAVLFVWGAAVFGTWAVILIPFIHAKERVMGHVDDRDACTLRRWMLWIGSAVGLLLVSALFWTRLFGSQAAAGAGALERKIFWAVAVFGSWFLMVLPLAWRQFRGLMQARGCMEEAAAREREEAALHFVQPEKRRLNGKIAGKLAAIPETLWGAHVVAGRLEDGRRVPALVINRQRELVGIHGEESLSFDPKELVDVEPVTEEALAGLTPDRWLWLDGRG